MQSHVQNSKNNMIHKKNCRYTKAPEYASMCNCDGNPEPLEIIKQELLTQNNRSTSWPIFIVVEDRRVYGVDSDFADGTERKEDFDEDDLCEQCKALDSDELPDECDDCMVDCFVNYRIERDVPNLYAGFFFTAKACDEHLEVCSHHYNKTAHSYAISATHNPELKVVIEHLRDYGKK